MQSGKGQPLESATSYPRYSYPQPITRSCVSFPTGAVVSGRRSGSPNSELLMLMIARRLLFDSPKGTSCVQSRGHSHSKHQLSSIRLYWDHNQRVDISVHDIVEQESPKIFCSHPRPCLTALIHVLNAVSYPQVRGVVTGHFRRSQRYFERSKSRREATQTVISAERDAETVDTEDFSRARRSRSPFR